MISSDIMTDEDYMAGARYMQNAQMVWRSIDTAPKDGTRIIGFGLIDYSTTDGIGFKPAYGVATVAWNSTYKVWNCDPNEATEDDPDPCELSHWMPLPAPPGSFQGW